MRKRIVCFAIALAVFVGTTVGFTATTTVDSYGARKTSVTDLERMQSGVRLGKIPIIMYHHFVEEIGEPNNAIISVDRFREHMMYLKDNGFTPLLPQDLKAIKDGTMAMPEKPVVISIDDGYESVYTYAYPILKETGMKATVNVIVDSIENPKPGEIKKFTWEQAREMYKSGYVDIQSHTYSLHGISDEGVQGIEFIPGETKRQYLKRVTADIEKSIRIIERRVGTEVISMAYPYGAYEEWGRDVLESCGIEFAVTTVETAADLDGNWYRLSRYSGDMVLNINKINEAR